MFAIRLINDGCYRGTEVYSDQPPHGLQGWVAGCPQRTKLTLDGSSRQAQEDLPPRSCARFMEVGRNEELQAFRCLQSKVAEMPRLAKRRPCVPSVTDRSK